MSARLISPEYCEELRRLHASPRGLGHSGRKHAAEVIAVTACMGVRTLLDYGCGAGTLKTALREQGSTLDVREYDPAVCGKDAPPSPADVVICTDVLEHVEPDKLRAVVNHIDTLARVAVFLVIALRPAHKMLPDGRNAHLIVQGAQVWEAFLRRDAWQLRSRFIRSDAEGTPTDVAFWFVKPEDT